MEPRAKKIMIVAIIYVILIGVVVAGLYTLFGPKATCSDGKQNQGEKAVDCGGPCSPCKTAEKPVNLLVSETAFANGGNGSYDVVGKLQNPNNITGGKSITYEFVLKDGAGAVIASRQGNTYILPNETRLVAELGLRTDRNETPVSVQMTIVNVDWSELINMGKPTLGIYNRIFDKVSNGVGNYFQALLKNESLYDLSHIAVVAVLRNEQGSVVAINSTTIDTVRSMEEREFRFVWPYAFSGDVSKIEVEAHTNVFDHDNFIRAK